jgi:O-antigen/teichoic acid export membrane protein
MDYMLVADWGAFGAVIGNGTCHTLMALGVWFRLWTLSEVRPDFATVFKLAGSTIAMALCAAFWAHRLPGVTGVAAAVVTGVVIYLAMLRLTAALGPEDRDRFGSLAKSLPQALRSPFERLLFTLVPEGRRAQLLL